MSFPQDTNYIINKLRDSYTEYGGTNVAKRVMRPYFCEFQYSDVYRRTSTTFDTMTLEIISQTAKYADNLLANAESPPIQTNIYINSGRWRRDDTSKESSDESDELNDAISVDDEARTVEYQRPNVSSNANLAHGGSGSGASGGASGSSSVAGTATRPRRNSARHVSKISQIKEESEEPDSNSNSVSTLTPQNPATTARGSVSKLVSLKKPNYRTSFGKFFSKSTGRKDDASDDTDSSDDESDSMVDDTDDRLVGNPTHSSVFGLESSAAGSSAGLGGAVGIGADIDGTEPGKGASMGASGGAAGSGFGAGAAGAAGAAGGLGGPKTAGGGSGSFVGSKSGNGIELIEDDGPDIGTMADEELNIDHDDQLDSYDFDSSEDSSLGGSFTDDDDEDDDSILNLAFERAANQLNLMKVSEYDSSANSTVAGSDVASIGSSLNASSATGAAHSALASVGAGIKLDQLKEKMPKSKKVFVQPPPIGRRKRSNTEIKSKSRSSHLAHRSVPSTTSSGSAALTTGALSAGTGATSIQFKKQPVEPGSVAESQVSKLSSLLKPASSSSNVLLRYESVSGKNLSNRAATNIDVYISFSKKYKEEPMVVRVRKDCTVLELLGYILLQYSTSDEVDDKFKYYDLNKWKLQLSDEGEVFQGHFGVLDRTNAISVYNPDEVTLIECDESEAKSNALKTPLPYKSNFQRSGSLMEKRLSRLNNSSEDKVVKEVEVKVHFNKYSINDYETISLKSTNTIGDMVEKFCEIRKIPPVLYCASLLNDELALDPNETFANIDEQIKDFIISEADSKKGMRRFDKTTTLKNLQVATSYNASGGKIGATGEVAHKQAYKSSAPSTPADSRAADSTANSYKKGGRLSSSLNITKSILKHSRKREPQQQPPSKVKTYHVWRRQQMNFISRHERLLTIDGEYVYILPNESGADSSHKKLKTSSFNVSQVRKVKVSSKAGSFFKIVIQRKNSSELKRYDFEAESVAAAKEIVRNIQKIKEEAKL